MIKLTITEKGGEPKALSFDKDEVSIGRVSGNDIVLPKGNVSKRHTKLAVRSGQIEISDLKSTNGTYVNGRKIGEPMFLAGTDRVYVGDFLITVDMPGVVEGGASGSRRLPVPPPPPPSRATGVQKPLEETTGMGGDEEEEALAAKPPRSSPRVAAPPPPPPPRPRQPTPLATAALEGDEHEEPSLAEELSAPSPREVVGSDDTTGNAGLFERRAAGDSAPPLDGAGRAGTGTGRRPGAALPAESPAPVVERPPGAEPAAAASSPGLPSSLEGLEALLADTAVTEIVITGPEAVYVDRGGGFSAAGTGLGDPNALADALWRMANTAVPPPAPDNPVVDVRLPDGTRLAAVFPPAAPAGVVASIRKPGLRERSLGDLVPSGARELQTLLEAAIGAQRNLLCTGDASALGALFGALAAAIPAERRVVSVGATPAAPRAGWSDLAPGPDMAALARVATALRPQHLLWGESAGAEALDLLLASARGQDGLAITLPARGTTEALARLDAMASPALGAGSGGAATLVASTVDLVVQIVSTTDGAARVVEIAQPVLEAGRLRAVPVATWQGDGGRRGSAGGRLEVQGVSAGLGASLSEAGHALPSSLVRK